MKAILIMMDTCCRHMLRLYRPEAKASTPNIDRLAAVSYTNLTLPPSDLGETPVGVGLLEENITPSCG